MSIIKPITSKPRILSAQFSVEPIRDLDPLSTEMADQIRKEIKDEIDKEIIFDLHKLNLKWRFVELPESCIELDVKEWCEQNLKGKYINHYSKWLIEQQEDATWFILRWVN